MTSSQWALYAAKMATVVGSRVVFVVAEAVLDVVAADVDVEGRGAAAWWLPPQLAANMHTVAAAIPNRPTRRTDRESVIRSRQRKRIVALSSLSLCHQH